MSGMTRYRRRQRRLTVGASLVAMMLTATVMVPGSGLAADPVGLSSDQVVAETSELSAAAIRAADISSTAKGKAMIADHIEAADVPAKMATGLFVAYDFGSTSAVISTATPFRVLTGLNEAGQETQEVVLSTGARGEALTGGYDFPPAAAWSWYENNSSSQDVGTCWRRVITWTVTKANNYGSPSYDYYRMFGKVNAAELTKSSCDANDGFKRAWIEFDIKSGWSPVNDSWEDKEPAQSYGLGGQTERTIGFGTKVDWEVPLGVAPLTVTGSVNTTYGVKMTSSTENLHPVVRSEHGSGGVQWCRYASAEFNGSKTFAGRVPARITGSGTMNDWDILTGMQDFTTNCPGQI